MWKTIGLMALVVLGVLALLKQVVARFMPGVASIFV